MILTCLWKNQTVIVYILFTVSSPIQTFSLVTVLILILVDIWTLVNMFITKLIAMIFKKASVILFLLKIIMKVANIGILKKIGLI